MAGEITLTLRQARLSWLARQTLLPSARSPDATLASVTGSIGWIPALSGATPYLALFARGVLSRRADLDDAAFARAELVAAPGPRGLTWLVPAADAPLARAFAMADHTSREARISSACELTARDLQSTRDALRHALATPRTPTQLRAALGPDELRPLGTSGRRSGVGTLAGLVLRALWIQGEVTRSPVDGRFDRERYRYALDPHPRVVPSGADAVDTIAPRWLAAHAPASARAFAEAFNIAAGRAATALKPLHPVNVRVEGIDEVLLAPPDFALPDERGAEGLVNLLPVHDPLIDSSARLTGLATPEIARALQLRNVGYAPVALLDGEAVGAWSWDGVRVSLRPLVALTSTARGLLDAQALVLGDFIARELSSAALHDSKAPRGALMLPGEIQAEQ